ncbi:Alpha/beta hydrolase family protein [Pseudoruegeria aquimaris]|uniref:Alpha/beta hydrolase family protein n=1 Tax=Pseudoruegeria aquimaris TaxID=393663 RepID=A0A1Y5SKJ3_9RHOB|nr:alpha/beta fold hydrolase [Pseudoruegeria aquimaris]SLN39793.1 Alpha/beta hydrolase family protein [Pseudoruegeria aquimaris]
MRHLRLAETRATMEEIRFPCDGAELSGRLFRPSHAPKAAIVIHGATGVPQGFYRPFAEWLSREGYACLTYDYRDFGASAVKPPKDSEATMAIWGLKDQPAAQEALETRVPGVPVWVIGHSLGGLMIPFQQGAGRRLSRVITVASGPVHFSDHPLRYKPVTAAFWYGPGPLATAMLGYLPGRAMGLGPDLPAGVYWQWRRWCTTPGFNACDVGRDLPEPDPAAVQCPVKHVAVADDVMVPPAAVWRLMQLYPEAPKRQLTLRPADFGLKRIGHIGMFNGRNAATWPAIIA